MNLIESLDDFLLRLAARGTGGEILAFALYGVWLFCSVAFWTTAFVLASYCAVSLVAWPFT